MSETPPDDEDSKNFGRTGISLGAFLVAFLFVWLVFDNIALALLAGLLLAGGGEVAQRAVGRHEKNTDDQTDRHRP